jgi:hypothetical protein
MENNYLYDYAVIRLVPKVDREEFLNVGIIVLCEEKKFLDALIEIDENRFKTFNPEFDIETAKSHLKIIPAICSGSKEGGPVASLSQAQRFHWLTSPKSTIIQISPVHSGYCRDPLETLRHLFKVLVKTTTE